MDLLVLLVLSATLAISTERLLNLSCADAFTEYKEFYGRKYATPEAEQIAGKAFCDTHAFIKGTVNKTSVHVFNNMSDWAEMPRGFISPNEKIQIGAEECGDDVYLIPNPLPSINIMPQTVDMRLQGLQTTVKNQGLCGSCWAFATTAIMETSILRMHGEYVKNKNYAPYFGDTSLSLALSQQFLMNTSTIGNKYCEGGNFIYAIGTLASGFVLTMETEKDFPYTAGDTSAASIAPTRPTPKLPVDSFLTPILVDTTECPASLVQLYAQQQAAFGSSVIEVVKSYIARGVSVAAACYIETDRPASFQAFKSYSSGVLDYPCVEFGADHQVAFVGFGFYKGTPVWVVRNSHGSDWGVEGFFYTSIGKDSFCIEHYAYTVVPKYMDLKTVDAYQAPEGTVTPFDNIIIPGGNGLDVVEETQHEIDMIIIIVVCCVGAVLLGVGIYLAFVIRRKLRGKYTKIPTADEGIPATVIGGKMAV